MLSDLLTSPTAPRAAAFGPDVSPSRDGPVTVAVGEAVDTTLRAGALVADALGRGMAVISVIEPVAVYLWNTPGVPITATFEDERTIARWSFLEHRLRAASATGVAGSERDLRWSLNVVRGGVARTVAHAARDLRSPYVVMGIGHHRPVDRLLGGETALRAVRHADCPVLAVTTAFTALPRTVVAGVDFSDASAHAVRLALPLLAPGGTLHIVHAWQPGAAFPGQEVPLGAAYRRAMSERLAAFVATLHLPPTLSVRTATLEGAPAERLLAHAVEVNAEMIVVGRQGRNLLERLLVGSVAARVLRSADRAVLVVPDPPPSTRLQLAAHRGATMAGVPREDWASSLERFSRRFAGRMVSLDIYDPEHSLHTQERGSVLFGASFDSAEGQLEIILGEPHGRRRHLTRVIPDASGLSMLVGSNRDEQGLLVTHGSGETLLTVFPVPSQSKM
jgi:Universal stress protein UspA and related nucleotide-binding proteins